MPKIRITEYDKTGVVSKSPVSNIVYIPIETEEAYSIVDENGKVQALFSSKKDFQSVFKDKLKKYEMRNEPTAVVAYNIASRLLDLGFQIVAEGVAITAGEDGIQKASVDKEILKDKSLLDIRFLTAGCFAATEGVDMRAIIVEVAEAREDCIALIHIDEPTQQGSMEVADIRTAFEKYESIYAAGFTPWFKSTHPTLIANVLKDVSAETPAYVSEVNIPASYGYLFAYARMIQSNLPEWNAVAGPQRGIIPELSDVCYTYSAAEIEILQARATTGVVELDEETDNVGIAINPIAWVRPEGYIIYGNRTLKNNDSIKHTTAQSFLNVRNGINAIKKTLYDAGRKFVFEQNTEVLWINFKNYVTPLLDQMQNNGGILGYTFVKVKTDAKARLKAKLTVVPAEAVEDFDIAVYLVDDLTVSEE